MINIPVELNYGDVYMRPQKTVVASRSVCNTSVKLGKNSFDMPVYAANMRSVVNQETCEFFANHKWFYTMHRFGVDSLSFTSQMHKQGLISSISVGVQESDETLISSFSPENAPEFITIDIANAYTDRVMRVLGFIKSKLPNTFVIAGNVATPEAVEALQLWGADAIKVGIAAGVSCITKNKTGFHRPMVTTIIECAQAALVPIIADGGIKEHGDIAKAIACGATMVMAGSLFSGYDESAGDILEINGHKYKEYYGSASEFNKSRRQHIEGKRILVDYKGSMVRLLDELQEDLRSSISYAGGSDLTALHQGLLLRVK